jgi:hypothetical protein
MSLSIHALNALPRAHARKGGGAGSEIVSSILSNIKIRWFFSSLPPGGEGKKGSPPGGAGKKSEKKVRAPGGDPFFYFKVRIEGYLALCVIKFPAKVSFLVPKFLFYKSGGGSQLGLSLCTVQCCTHKGRRREPRYSTVGGKGSSGVDLSFVHRSPCRLRKQPRRTLRSSLRSLQGLLSMHCNCSTLL